MMKDEQDIVKSNALIEACYNPGSTYQMRLMLAALMQIKAKEELDFRHYYSVSANSLSDLTGTRALENYKELERAAKSLRSAYVTVHQKPNGEKGLPDKTEINIVSSCQYYKGEGRVELRFTEEITPYISSLRSRFTKYQAKYVMPMRSSYGIRLYELCLQWLGDEREFEVGDFRKIFGLEKKYATIRDLKRRVIDPAIDDINTYSDIHVEFGQRKRGRVVSHFQFKIIKKKPAIKIKKLTQRDWIAQYKMARAGESWDEAIKRTSSEYLAYKANPNDWVERVEAAKS